jgi:hypothetical protein
MSGKKKTTLNPAAAKILEQYRNTPKTGAASPTEGTAGPDSGAAKVQRPAAPPPGSAAMRRSGTRGK